MDIIEFLLAIFAGVISSIIIVGYTYSETERKKLNQNIDLLFEEIDFNRNKVPRYSTFFTESKNEWEQKRELKWINNNEISIGYGGFFCNFLKFDTYNLFTLRGLNLYLNSELGYDRTLKILYHKSKKFCAITQDKENQIRQYQDRGEFEQISLKWNEIDEEFKKISKVFEDEKTFSIENKEQFHIGWIEWHIKRIRKVKQEVSIMSRLIDYLFPYGWDSAGCWGLGILGIFLIFFGGYIFREAGPLFSDHPTTFTLINSIGIFLMGLGFAILFFSVNRHSSYGSEKNTKIILKKLEEIENVIKKCERK